LARNYRTPGAVLPGPTGQGQEYAETFSCFSFLAKKIPLLDRTGGFFLLKKKNPTPISAEAVRN
jgi:hypothetical protein